MRSMTEWGAAPPFRPSETEGMTMTDHICLDKVSATPAARQLLAEIIADHGPVLFHQSGGCCDGSSPMCYPRGDFMVGDHDVLLGEIDGTPVYISGSQYEAWKNTDITIDVVAGRGGMFSLDNGREKRFLTRSDVCAVPT
jgi:uncharacterized protein